MAGSSRKRRPTSGITAPFASIPASQLATQRLRRLSGDAVRVLLVAHAAWTPETAAVLPVARIARMVGLSKRSVSAAIRALTGAEFLTLLKPAKRPGAMGVARGMAAVFEVAGRRPGTRHRVFETGDRRLHGCVRIGCTDLRRLAAMMTGNEARILATMVLPCARDRHGAPQQPKPLALSGRTTAAALAGMSARAADAAIKGLVARGLLREVTPAAGRRPATFEPAGLAATMVRRGRRGRAGVSSAGMELHEGRDSAHKPPEQRPDRVSLPRHDGVVRRTGTTARGLCAEPGPANKQRVSNDAPTATDLTAALRLAATGPVIRDMGQPAPIPYPIWTALIARGHVTTVRRPDPAGGTYCRAYAITKSGRAALARSRGQPAADPSAMSEK